MTDEFMDRLRQLTETLPEHIFFRQLLDYLPSALIVIDEKQAIQLVNRQLELLFGYPREMLYGKDHAMLLPEELRERHHGHIAHFFENPALHLEGVRSDGGRIVTNTGVWAMALLNRVPGNGPD